MPDFAHYQREDFLANESFTNYLLQKNAKDIQFWSNWINDNPQCGNEVKEAGLLFFLLRDQKELLHSSGRQIEVDNEYWKLQSLLNENNVVTDDEIMYIHAGQKFSNNSLLRKIAWKAAAVAAFFLMAVSTWMYFGPGKNAHFQNIAKTNSSVKELSLPDGSQVQLNINSSLDITKDYNKEKREVLLNGSAFFKVYKDHSKPFIVTAGSIKTTALGTSFYIYNPNTKSISVSLLEGSVRVEGDKNYVELLPGEKAIYTSGEPIYKESFNKIQLLNFTKGKIQFEHSNLQEIKTVLEEYFNKDVLINGNAPKLNFTGSFDAKRIETILEALQFTYNIKYKLEDQKLTISF